MISNLLPLLAIYTMIQNDTILYIYFIKLYYTIDDLRCGQNYTDLQYVSQIS